jgi:hypothetical protein
MSDTEFDNIPNDRPSKAEWLKLHRKPDNFSANQITLHDTCETYGFGEQTYTPEIREWVRNFHEQQKQKREKALQFTNRQTWLQKLCPEHLEGGAGIA